MRLSFPPPSRKISFSSPNAKSVVAAAAEEVGVGAAVVVEDRLRPRPAADQVLLADGVAADLPPANGAAVASSRPVCDLAATALVPGAGTAVESGSAVARASEIATVADPESVIAVAADRGSATGVGTVRASTGGPAGATTADDGMGAAISAGTAGITRGDRGSRSGSTTATITATASG